MSVPTCNYCGRQRSVCRLCDGPAECGCYDGYSHLPGCEIARVCYSCAEIVANAFNMRHGGQWLTWPNPPRQKPSKARIPRSLSKRVFERDGYRCVTCGDHRDLTCDHVIAESKGGETTFENLQTMCRPCNCRKGTT